VLTYMHVKRLKWAGHVVWTPDIRIPKQILKGICREKGRLEKQGIDEKANC